MCISKLNRLRIIIFSIMNTLYQCKTDDKIPENVIESYAVQSVKKLNFEHCIRPIYYISRACGLLPFSITRNSNREIQTPRINVFDFLFFTLSIIWYLFLTYNSFHGIQYWPSLNRSQVLTVSNYSLLILGLIFGVLTITMDMFNRTRLVAILKKFITFDQNVIFYLSFVFDIILISLDFIQMESFGVQFDYKQERKCILLYYVVKLMIAILLSISLLFIYTNVRDSYSPLSLVKYFGPHIFQYVIMSNISTTYVTVIRCLRQRFTTLNSLLR